MVRTIPQYALPPTGKAVAYNYDDQCVELHYQYFRVVYFLQLIVTRYQIEFSARYRQVSSLLRSGTFTETKRIKIHDRNAFQIKKLIFIYRLYGLSMISGTCH